MSKSLYKDAIKNIIYSLFVCEMFVFFGSLLEGIKGYGKFIEDFVEHFKMWSEIVIGFGIFVIVLLTVYYIITKITRWFYRIDTEMYIREIPAEIPPAIASLLYDTYIETDKDYTATLVGLFVKNHIEIIEKNIIIKDKDTSKLLAHEMYVLEVISKKREFKKREFRKLIIEDAINLKLFEKIDKKTINKRILYYCIALAVFAVLLIWSLYNTFAIAYELPGSIQERCILAVFLIFLAIFMILLYRLISQMSPGYDQSMHYRYSKTELGYKYTVLVAAIAKFFKEYTIIHEREIESAELLGEHIAYAIALDKTDKIEKFMINDIEFREIMYMNKYTGRYKYDFFMHEK